jgi:hypothetical protein
MALPSADLLWYLAVLSGWSALIAQGLAWSARKTFRALLKAPLTEEVEHMTHVSERQIGRRTVSGFFLSGLSILCFCAWLASSWIPLS